MLHDPSHYTAMINAEKIRVSAQDKDIPRELYQWNHLSGDMVVNPWMECPKTIHRTDFWIMEDTDIAKTNADGPRNQTLRESR